MTLVRPGCALWNSASSRLNQSTPNKQKSKPKRFCNNTGGHARNVLICGNNKFRVPSGKYPIRQPLRSKPSSSIMDWTLIQRTSFRPLRSTIWRRYVWEKDAVQPRSKSFKRHLNDLSLSTPFFEPTFPDTLIPLAPFHVEPWIWLSWFCGKLVLGLTTRQGAYERGSSDVYWNV